MSKKIEFNKVAYLFLFSTIMLFSCTKDRGEFKFYPLVDINVTDITASSAKLSWSTKYVYNDTLKYDVYLGDKLVAEKLLDSVLVIDNLEEFTDYTGKILTTVASSERSSEDEFQFKTIAYSKPSEMEITVTDITKSSGVVNWTESTVADGQKVVYDVYANEDLIVSDLEVLSYKLENLSHTEEYTIEVVARTDRDKKTKNEYVFTPYGTAPSSFTIGLGDNGASLNDLDAYSIKLEWTTPTVEDGSSFHYDTYINDNYFVRFDSDVNSVILDNYTPDTEYTFKVVASSDNNNSRTESFTYKTIKYNTPTPFSITVNDITNNKADISWTESINPEDQGYQQYFKLYIDDKLIASGSKIEDRSYTLDNLSPDTEYNVKIVSVIDYVHSTQERTETTIFKTTTN